MSQVMMTQAKQRPDELGQVLQIASLIPSPVQPVAAGVAVAKGLSAQPGQANPQIDNSSKDALQRRMQGMQSQQQNLMQLQDAHEALAYLPPEQQRQYGPPIQKALYSAQQEYA